MAAMKGIHQDGHQNPPGLVDMEDVCGICSDWNIEITEGDEHSGPPRRPFKRSKQNQLPSATPSLTPGLPGPKGQHDHGHALSPEAAEAAMSHAGRFPVKVSKKTVREEETVVCAIRRSSDGCYLIQKRPEKGKPAMRTKTRPRHQLTRHFCRASRRVVGTPKPGTSCLREWLYGCESKANGTRVCGRALWLQRWPWEDQHQVYRGLGKCPVGLLAREVDDARAQLRGRGRPGRRGAE